ncbi:MAG: SHOCT domain-containing protein [Nitrosotalea sp.]
MGYLISLLVLGLFSLTIAPVYAEVTSLHTDRTLYAIDMNMYFTGTVNQTGSQIVNLEIHDPHGKLVLITGNASESDGNFQITVNTDDPNQFSLEGTYNATAFVNDESEGKTVLFDFSPNGSPIVSMMPVTQNNTQLSQNTNKSNTSLQNSNQRHESVLHEDITIDDTLTLTTVNSTYADSEQSSNGYDFKNILYPAMIICGAGIVGFILYRKKMGAKSGMTTSHESSSTLLDVDETQEDYALVILKNRLAKGEITIEEFKVLKDALSEP